jgi:hypothetical protein
MIQKLAFLTKGKFMIDGKKYSRNAYLEMDHAFVIILGS